MTKLDYTPGKWRQVIATVIVCLGSFTIGIAIGWTGTIMREFRRSDNPLGRKPINDNELSWLSSTSSIGMFTSLFIGSRVSELVGRKKTTILTAVIYISAWLMKYLSKELSMLLISMFLSGIGCGVASAVIPPYITEIASSTIRGRLGNSFSFSMKIGYLTAFILGALLSYEVFTLSCLIISITQLVGLSVIPETPVYLVRRDRIDEARRSLMWLRGNDETIVDAELSDLKQFHLELMQSKSSLGIKDLFADQANRKGLIISVTMAIIQQGSGTTVLMMYIAMIMDAAKVSVDAYIASIIFASAQLFGCWLSTLTVDRFGRRPLLLISTSSMACSYIILTVFPTVQHLHYNVSDYSWLPIVAVVSHTIADCIGIGPLAPVVANELFNPELASICNSIFFMIFSALSFLLTKFFPFIISAVGFQNSFSIFLASCTAGFFIILLFILGINPVNDNVISWLSSTSSIGMFTSLFIGSRVSELVGRKKTAILMAVVYISAWLMQYLAQQLSIILSALFLNGFACGVASSVIPLYITEIAGKTIRGRLGNLFIFSMKIGYLYAFILSAMLSHKVLTLCCLVLPIIQLLGLSVIPETPVYLVRRDRLDEARRSLMWLRGNDATLVDAELSHLKQFRLELMQSKSSICIRELFTDRANRRGFIISLTMATIQQGTGTSVLMMYIAIILDAAKITINTNIASIIFASAQLFGCWLSTVTVDRFGRRPLLLISTSGMACSYTILSVFLTVQHLHYDVSNYNWLPIVAVVSYAITYCIGIGPLASVVANEVYNPEFASICNCIFYMLFSTQAFLLTKFFPFIISSVGFHNCFFIFVATCIAGFFIILWFIPETKGKSIELIREELQGK